MAENSSICGGVLTTRGCEFFKSESSAIWAWLRNQRHRHSIGGILFSRHGLADRASNLDEQEFTLERWNKPPWSALSGIWLPRKRLFVRGVQKGENEAFQEASHCRNRNSRQLGYQDSGSRTTEKVGAARPPRRKDNTFGPRPINAGNARPCPAVLSAGRSCINYRNRRTCPECGLDLHSCTVRTIDPKRFKATSNPGTDLANTNVTTASFYAMPWGALRRDCPQSMARPNDANGMAFEGICSEVFSALLCTYHPAD